MNFLHALILSGVEGITEFLPVSSTGHLVLTASLLSISQTDFVKSFEIVIQLGAILAVVFLYRNTLIRSPKIWKPLFAAFLPTSVIGFLLYATIKRSLLGNTAVTVAALGFGGVILVALELWGKGMEKKGTIDRLSWNRAVYIGLAQALSVVPGVSRAAATIVGGLAVGLSRSEAVVFSFLLAIPTMIAASALDMAKSSFLFTPREWWLLTTGFIGAFLTALITVRIFTQFVKNHSLVVFGVYRIVVALLFWFVYR